MVLGFLPGLFDSNRRNLRLLIGVQPPSKFSVAAVFIIIMKNRLKRWFQETGFFFDEPVYRYSLLSDLS